MNRNSVGIAFFFFSDFSFVCRRLPQALHGPTLTSYLLAFFKKLEKREKLASKQASCEEAPELVEVLPSPLLLSAFHSFYYLSKKGEKERKKKTLKPEKKTLQREAGKKEN